MGGITMWIILGGLIGLVVIFLIVTSVLDKKKRKKIIIEKTELDIKVNSSGKNVCSEVLKVIKKNDAELKKFVPAVGNKKMSDINNEAKKGLSKIKQSQNFKLLKHNEEENNLFVLNLEALIKEKSNNWSKRNKSNLNFFKNYKPITKKEDEVKKSPKSKKGKK